jgi:hypothetical protein
MLSAILSFAYPLFPRAVCGFVFARSNVIPVFNLNFSNGFKGEISLNFRTLIVTAVKFPFHLPFCPVTHCVYLIICSMLEAQFTLCYFGTK